MTSGNLTPQLWTQSMKYLSCFGVFCLYLSQVDLQCWWPSTSGVSVVAHYHGSQLSSRKNLVQIQPLKSQWSQPCLHNLYLWRINIMWTHQSFTTLCLVGGQPELYLASRSQSWRSWQSLQRDWGNKISRMPWAKSLEIPQALLSSLLKFVFPGGAGHSGLLE